MQTEYYRKTSLKNNARQQAKKQIPLKNKCELCGSTEWLERHHPDYNKPMEVQTLCRSCHARQRAQKSDKMCICPKCGSTFTARLGSRVTKQGRKQTRVCKDCGRGFYEAEHLAVNNRSLKT